MEDRELEFLIGDLEQENRLLRARNERLEKELAEAEAKIARLETYVNINT
jgi:phage shock protein A